METATNFPRSRFEWISELPNGEWGDNGAIVLTPDDFNARCGAPQGEDFGPWRKEKRAATGYRYDVFVATEPGGPTVLHRTSV